MKNLLLGMLCVLLSIAPACSSSEADASAQSASASKPESLFNPHEFVGLIEEYTHITKTAPTTCSESSSIAHLIERITDANAQIELELRHHRLAGGMFHARRDEDRLKHYNESAKTALKALNRRHELVKTLPLAPEESLAQESRKQRSLFALERLSDSYLFVKNSLPPRAQIQGCLLNLPMLTMC